MLEVTFPSKLRNVEVYFSISTIPTIVAESSLIKYSPLVDQLRTAERSKRNRVELCMKHALHQRSNQGASHSVNNVKNVTVC